MADLPGQETLAAPPADSAGREYPSVPRVAVGAMIARGDRVLLVRRGREPAKGIWTVPGGGVELGETVEEAVRREIREETGLEIALNGVLGLASFTYGLIFAVAFSTFLMSHQSSIFAGIMRRTTSQIMDVPDANL